MGIETWILLAILLAGPLFGVLMGYMVYISEQLISLLAKLVFTVAVFTLACLGCDWLFRQGNVDACSMNLFFISAIWIAPLIFAKLSKN